MANVLGSLFVELGVNTAAFVDGMSKATYQAEQGAKKIGSSLSGIGSIVSEIGEKLGEFGGIVGQALGTVGNTVSTLVHHMGDLSGGAGIAKAVGIGFLGLGAAAVTAGAALIGIAVHAAEGAAHLHELSQATGVSVPTLSGLSVVARLVGVDVDTLAKSLERMDKSALAAAQSPDKASNAYRTLGINVRDSNGQLKPTSELFKEVADKFSVMEDGATKTALAMQIFGRGGASLIPVLNKGGESMQYWIDYGTKVGAVLTDQAAKGAHDFEEQLTKLGLISTGVQNKLMVALLPAISHIVDALTSFLEKGNAIPSMGSTLGTVLSTMTGWVLKAANAWTWWGDQFDIWGAKLQKAEVYLTMKLGGDPTGKLKQQLVDLDKQVAASEANIQRSSDRLAIALADLNGPIKPTGPESPAQTQKAPAVGAVTPTTSFKQPVDEVMKYLKTLEEETTVQVALAASVGKTTEEIKKQEAAAAAESTIIKMREGLISKQSALEESLATAKAEGGQKNVQNIKNLENEIAFITKEIGELDANRGAAVSLEEIKARAAGDTSFAKHLVEEIEKINAHTQSLKLEAAAAFQSAEAQRQAAAQAKAAQLLANAPSGTNRDAVVAAVKAESDAEYQKAIAVKAESMIGQKAYQQELTDLRAIDAQYGSNRDIHLAAIAAEQAAENKMQTMIDQTALKVGTIGEKWNAVLSQMQIANENVGAKIFGSISKGIDGLSTQLSNMVVTGKSNFKQLFDSLEQEILKELFSQNLTALITKLSGLFGAGTGSSSSGGSASGGIGGIISGIMGAFGFGGGKAGGGPVAPGVAYMVGEQGPETFVPGVAGSIVPNPGSSGSQVNANVTMNVHGATDPDTFRKAAPQIGAELFRQLQLAHARNGG